MSTLIKEMDDLKIVDPSPFPFHKLPNEFLTKVIRKLDKETRDRLSLVNDLLKGLVKNAGYRNFKYIIIKETTSNPAIVAVYVEDVHNRKFRFRLTQPVHKVASYLSYATTEELRITSRLNEESTEKLQIALKSLLFDELYFEIYDDNSFRLLKDLIRKKKVENVSIWWCPYANYDTNIAKNILLNLPQTKKCEIAVDHSIIDEDILLHLAKSSNLTDLSKKGREIAISAYGLANAFEICCTSTEKREIRLFVSSTSLNNFIEQLEINFEVHHTDEGLLIKHAKSGAEMNCTYFRGSESRYVRMFNAIA